jgi:hypothetical protein
MLKELKILEIQKNKFLQKKNIDIFTDINLF